MEISINKKNINKEILRIALPAILNNITVPLLGLCDTAIAGHLGSAAFIGAIAVGAMMMNVIFWLCGFLRAGTSGLTANAFGANDFYKVRDTIRKALIICCVISCVVLILQRPLLSVLISIVGPDPVVAPLAIAYFKILVWTVPAQLAIMAVTGWFIGLGNTVVPMVIAVGVNIINILLSIILVFVCKLEFQGIAYGTFFANWLGAIAAIGFLLRKSRNLPGAKIKIPIKWSSFFSMNSFLFLRSACIMGVSLSITSICARIGEDVLAVNAVMMQFFLFFSYFMDGYAYAAEALVGRSYGANDFKALSLSISRIFVWGAGMALLFTIVYWAAGMDISKLLTNQVSVIAGISAMHLWLVALPGTTVAAFLFDGVFIGLNRTAILFATTFFATLIFAIIIIVDLANGRLPSISTLWLAFESYLLTRGALLAMVYLYQHYKPKCPKNVEN